MEPTIALLQDILARLGYLTGTPERQTLDDLTRAALRRFQQIHALDPSGEPDERVWQHLLAADERGECVITGQVVDQAGPLAHVAVVLRDRELGDPANWPVLGSPVTDRAGQFVAIYVMEQVLPGDRPVGERAAVADLVIELAELAVDIDGFAIERLPGGEPVSADDQALGIQARRFEELRIIVNTTVRRWSEGASEYERLLAAFHAVWPDISPATLDDARREPEFVARELGAPPGQIDALVAAFRMHQRVFDGTVSTAILYGLACCDQHLTDIARLALARLDQIKEGIIQAVERLIIPPQSDAEIEQAMRQIESLAPENALAGAGASGYRAVLGDALPDVSLQSVLLRAAAGRGDNPPALWDDLRADPQFAQPGDIERAQFAVQLDALTNRHIPLMQALQREQGLTSTRALLDLDPAELQAIVTRPDVGAPAGTPGDGPEERAATYVAGLVGQLQHAFPTETIAKSLAAAPADIVGGETVQRALSSFLSSATSQTMQAAGTAFDIRQTHVDAYLATHGAALLAEIAEEARPLVAAELKRAQRLYRVSAGKDSFDWLLGHGYNSAFDIAQIPQQTFVGQAAGALGEHQALMIHSQASATGSAALSVYTQLNDALFGIYPAGILDGRDHVETAAAIEQEVAKYLPNWSSLFGQISWCDCPDCRSVYSPAAYLVDLLNFLDKSGKNPQGATPLDVLLTYRPDIAQLKLTCENTNTLIPYVDLVNEVLESLVISLDLAKIPPYDTDGATAAEQQASPQHTDWAAYATPAQPSARPRLDRALYPPGLPFDAPLRAVQTYLAHLEVNRADLMAAFGDVTLANALAAERLGLSPAMFAAITTVNLDETPADLPATLDDRYGWSLALPPDLATGASGGYVWALKRKLNSAGAALAIGADPDAELFDGTVQLAVQNFQTNQGIPASGAVDSDTWRALLPFDPPLAPAFLPHATVFLERSGVTFDELLSLLKMRFVNPEQQTFEIVRRLDLPVGDLLAFIQANLQNPGLALLAALNAAGVSEEEFAEWAQSRLAGEAWARLRQTILIDGPPGDLCDLSVLSIRRWEDAAPALGDDDWLRLDRLIRLWRALGWNIEDLDLALSALDASDIDAATIRRLALIADLARTLDLSLAQVVALWADLDPARAGGLYARRFHNRARIHDDMAFTPDWAGRILSGAVIGDHLPALQAGLRVSAADLTMLRKHLGLAADDAPLDLAGLSQLFRHVTLARALAINVRDLCGMLALTGLQPFQAPGDNWPAATFAAAVRRLQTAGLNAAQLAYILGDTGAPEPNEARDRLLGNLRDSLRAISAELDPASETDGSLTRRALALLQVEPRLIDAALSIALGVDHAATALAQSPVPAPAVPAEWADRLRYNPLDRSLTCRVALTDGERDVAKSFSTDAGYRAAIDQLYAMPRATLQQLSAALAAAGVSFPAVAALLSDTLYIDDPVTRELRIRARLSLLLAAILPPLHDRLSRNLVKQTISALPLDPLIVTLLLEGERAPEQPIFPASEPSRPLIADLLALADSDDMTAAVEAYELLVRLRLLVETLAFKADDLRVLTSRLAVLRAAPHQLCAYADWETIAGYAAIQTRAAQAGARLAPLWDAADIDAARAALIDMLGWPAETIAGLIEALAFDLSDIQQITKLERLIAAGDVVQRLGVTPAQAARWAREPATQLAANAAHDAVKARYDEAAWLEAARTLHDTLRDARRAALVTYLLPRLGVRDAGGLYQLLLIDVEMSSCMQTSRIKQAISSVQLFIQRCLLNKVQLVTPQAIDSQHWKWMQNYRVWEANRKVLLYPENWIVPELRDDKTPFFTELESALLQDDVTDPNAERALLGYLEKLDVVAKLEMIGMDVQQAFEPAEKLQTVVHVFGRTANPPHSYYYRRYVVKQNGTTLWTPWEVVPVDVQGALVAPVIFNRRLYLFWAVSATKTRETPADSKTPQKQQRYQEIQLAWSEYRDGAWSPKRVIAAGEALTEDFTPGATPPLTIQGTPRGPDVLERLEARVEGDTLRVLCITHRDIHWTDADKNVSYANKFTFDNGVLTPVDGNTGYTLALGTFVLDSCHGRLVKDDRMDQAWSSRGVVLRLKDGALEAKPLDKKPVAALTILAKTQPASQIAEDAWIHDQGGYLAFGDSGRVYFAEITSFGAPLSGMTAKPDFSYPLIEASPGISGMTSAKNAHALLSTMRASAETTQNVWAGASAALATIAHSAPQSAVAQNGQAPLKDRALLEATQIQQLGYGVALARQRISIRFEPLFHPFACTYIKKLQQYGVPGVLTLANQQLSLAPRFALRYQPAASVATPYPTDGVDFGATEKPGVYRASAYAIYNWELFFHAPMLIADRLSQNRRFEDAMHWYHYVFNPTDGHGGYWKVLPLQKTPKQTISEWLQLLNAGDAELKRQIAEWRDHPFEPHRIARMRLPAYQKWVVMRYIDNLIAWGDSLFERDTIESINQATQLYILAAELLGPRPARIPPRGEATPLTFAEMRGKLDALSNIVAEYENVFPALSSATLVATPETAGLLGISRSLYFGIPANEKLLGYWDTVADRLYKIRNCMNLAGVVRQLPLFEPPIDPALLVRAAAQGLDFGAVLSDLSAPLPYYRFSYMLQKALDACSDLKSLGAALLAALEKKDAEMLAAMRATHETALLNAMLEIKKQQEDEAAAQIEALNRSRDVPVERLRYSRWLMGSDDLAAPQMGGEIPMLPYSPKPTNAGGVFLIDEEQQELAAAHSARDWQVRATFTEVLASAMSYLPNFSVVIAPMGSGTSMSFGGSNYGAALGAVGRYQAGLGAEDTYTSIHAGKMAGYRRRAQEYALQANTAAREIMQIDRQITAAAIRKAITRLEREQIERQIAQAELVEEHFKTKYTNAELYGWMQGQIAGIYFQAYQLASALAKQAERCFRFERGVTNSNYIQAGVWDNLRKGLLAGEKLQLQLKQLERAYLDQNRRDFEITRQVSLLQHAPLALIRLRETGRCEFDIPESLYDMDYPGHYMRRIKSVSLTIPAVVGPYSSVNATLTMLANETRINSTLRGSKYERELENEDGRFVDDFAAIQSIAASSAQNDSGMFELNFRDERYLPFEGAGAASRWRVDIDPDCNRFALESIADVVIQIRYTARDGGQQLRQKAKEYWAKVVADSENAPLARLFSLKHEFPTEWYRLRTVAEANGEHIQTIALTRDRFPLLLQRGAITIGQIDLFGVPKPSTNPTKLPALRTPRPDEALVELTAGAPLKPLLHQTGVVQVIVKDSAAQAGWRLSVAPADVAASLDQLDDMLIVCHYSVKT